MRRGRLRVLGSGRHCARGPLRGRRLDLDGRPEVASWLMSIRSRLESAASEADAARARLQLYELLDTGDADGG